MRSRAALAWRLALGCAPLLASAAWPAFAVSPLALTEPPQIIADIGVQGPRGNEELRIGPISILVFDVFDTAVPGESTSLARAANVLHPRTRPSVVRRELLFRTGDRLDLEALRQTERNLRALGLFRRVEVESLPPVDGSVGIVVRVYDAWSLTTGTSFRHEGGFSAYDARFREGNLAGFGVAVSLRYGVGFERRETDWSFSDQRLFGSRERLSVSFASRSDGNLKDVALSRPFYSLASPSAHAIGWRSTRERYRTYESGQLLNEYELQTTDGTFGWTSRVGSARNSTAWRLGGGYRLVARAYSLLPGAGSAAKLGQPSSYRWGGPYVGLEFLQHRYETRSGLLAPDRDVDVNFGLHVAAELFVSSPSTGFRTQHRTVAAVTVERGWHMPGRSLALLATRAGAERGGGLPARGDVGATIRLWVPHSATHVTAVLVEGRALLNADRAVLLYLGGTPGLRGYRENQFAGTRSLLAIIEERKFLSWRPAGLIRPGLAAFVEVGTVAGPPAPAARFHGDAGVGLRLANLRASNVAVLKVDLAVPIGEPWRGGRAVQLVVGFRREL